MEGSEKMMPAPDGEQGMNGQIPETGEPGHEKKKKNKPLIEKWIFFACAFFAVVAVVGIVLFIIGYSVPAFAHTGFFQFIFGTVWNSELEIYGILPMIVNSILVTLGALVFGGILGVFTAVFTVYWCPKKLKKPLEQVINVFAGIPSVIYGLFGMMLICPMLADMVGTSFGYGILACWLILMLMILPTIASMSKNALESVPESYYEGAIALGMTKAQVVFTVMLPAAKSGVISGLIMGTGRAIGEAMAVMMVCGNVADFPGAAGQPFFFSNISTLTTAIAGGLPYASALTKSALMGTGFVLMIFVLILNFIISFMKRDKTASGEKVPKKVKEGASAENANFFVKVGHSIAGAAKCVGGAIAGGAGRVKAAIIGKRGFSSPETGEFPEYVRKSPEYKKKGIVCEIFKYVGFVITAFVVIMLGILIVYVIVMGVPNLSADFLFGESSYAHQTMAPAFVNTIMVILLSLVIALPIGICAAVFLHEYAKPGSKVVKAIRLFTDTLSGIPSIVFGLFGNLLFYTAFGLGYTLLGGSITMALIILPTIIRSVEESLIAVPDSLREASLALGASKFQTLYKVILPMALPGILTAAVLSIGRIVGESAALLYTAGSSMLMPRSGYMSGGGTFAVLIYKLATEGRTTQERNQAFAVAFILILLVVIIYVGLGLIEYFSKKEKGQKKHKEKIKPPEVTA